MIHTNALCDDAPHFVRDDMEYVSYWGRGYLCCDACRSIATARDAWEDLYV